ncbi:HAMP domain-containing protein [Paraconexibacter antarcticus]|uniref:HAMP domain-containing protein n=1 Tax=Paraconexibacter antarcticus TaxID=2949664 RepID=A0ABY5DQP2_9ACTN|nr:adenylate/guanylate cyclase domain-containing protein [Paraconexibacter antarcticus]UTI63397.1 HAMP domain-containing protein [Paraconexibacter antarcticus]
MLGGPMRWLYAKFGRRYVRVVLCVQMQGAHLVVAGGAGLLQLFVHASTHTFVELLLVAEAVAVLDNLVSCTVVSRLLRPADPWMDGDHSPQAAEAAWRALAGLPLQFVRVRVVPALPLTIAPVSAFAVWRLELPFFPSFFTIAAAAAIVLLYGALLRFFAMEIITRPVLEAVAADVGPEADPGRTTISLRLRLLVALPSINIISGVVVSAVSAGGHRSIDDLGFGVAVAIAVAFTISLELTLLLANSILQPLRELRKGTDAVAAGDLGVRVPVLSSDETGALATSFNSMVAGLQERERLREAFGAYVDPQLAERVLTEGTDLGGEEVEVTVLFVDIRDFTAFAERASANEVVRLLNDFYGTVVPVIARHGGHANKFVGDGLLAVFGAPAPLEDHADRAVAAGVEVVARVRERFATDLRVGMGINSGPVVAGTMGGGGRVEFTVIGDPVNTASRVEAVTRITGDDVLLTEATRCLLRRDHGPLEERPTVELKGKTERVRLYAAIAAAVPPEPDAGDRPVVSRAE